MPSTHMDLAEPKPLAKKLAREIDAFAVPDIPEGVSQFEAARVPAKTAAKAPAKPTVAEGVK
jgi:hypothetical protein